MMQDLLNRPIRDLRISVTDKCNFRCKYCMPEEVFGFEYKFLARSDILTFEEIARVANLFMKLGVTKVRLTGGEPLLRQNLAGLIQQLSGIAGLRDLALTTNGYYLQQNAHSLRAAGLERITVSLDTLDANLFRKMAGRHLSLDTVLAGIDAAFTAGFTDVKVNTVVQRGVNEQEIIDLAEFGRRLGVTIRFIEYMDVGNLNKWRLEHVVPAGEILDIIRGKFSVGPLESNYRGEVARRYQYSDSKGEFGVIASVTAPFCGDCSRIRLSAEGKLFTCLFSADGVDLKSLIRGGASDAELQERIVAQWQQRSDRYSEERSEPNGQIVGRKVEMYQIGG